MPRSRSRTRDEDAMTVTDLPAEVKFGKVTGRFLLTAVDSVLIPIQCEFYALEGVSQLVSTIDLVRKNMNPDINSRILRLVTMHETLQ